MMKNYQLKAAGDVVGFMLGSEHALDIIKNLQPQDEDIVMISFDSAITTIDEQYICAFWTAWCEHMSPSFCVNNIIIESEEIAIELDFTRYIMQNIVGMV